MDAETESMGRSSSRRWRNAAWAAIGLVMLALVIAKLVTNHLGWGLEDFVIAAVLFGSVGIAFEVASRHAANAAYRVGVGIALAASFLLVWINGAVGIIGAEGNDANLLYGGVLAVGIGGAFAARGKARGMAKAMLAAAAAQIAVGAVALAAGLGTEGASWPLDVVVLTGLFALLFAVSAGFFLRSARVNR